MTIIDWYEGICKDEAFNDIATLMQKRGLLSASSVNLAKEIKAQQSRFRRLDFLLELKKKRRKIELLSTTDPMTMRAYTSVKVADMIDVELNEESLECVELEATIDGDKLILKQVNQVLEAMRQDIAELRAIREGK